ncbi:hypothetical protein FE391_31995 [Nonomuraea sp. KC401]|uniref:Uncharacterized protein n=1 Tax=Nonomuraea longispora TaxID=1848320 RepID=A0A4R4MXN4_9ACTN|nr:MULTISPECIES: hypothetical protein [Nonomuraea]NBE98277.1 hypothetical protein [Nonomuraea sp. K271]TDC01051.1 hypothetical protein E1267_32970 [Nonomuraea longispora]TLF61604.1 hypothetical protein FE391_31995 [Nonomuraea sp. KC401]
MDMRAEILELKLRVEELESGVRHGIVAAGSGRPPDRQAELLREIDDRTRSLLTEVAAVRSALADGRVEMVEQFAAVETEVAAIRREVKAWPSSPAGGEREAARPELEEKFSSLRAEMTDLGVKLDRLLKRENG